MREQKIRKKSSYNCHEERKTNTALNIIVLFKISQKFNWISEKDYTILWAHQKITLMKTNSTNCQISH